MSLSVTLVKSAAHMGVQRGIEYASTLVTTFLVVRALEVEEYGLLALITSYGVVFNLVNVSASAVLLRDFARIRVDLPRYMGAFLAFGALKGMIVALLSAAIGAFLLHRYGDHSLIGLLALNAVAMVALYLSEPLTTLLTVDFKNHILTRINIATNAANLIGTTGVIIFPSALFVSAKNAGIAILTLVLIASYAVPRYRLSEISLRSAHGPVLRECLVGFSLWTHLSGILTELTYRADLLILGWLNPSLRTLGNYSIALQIGNIAKVLPQILQLSTTLGLTHSASLRRRHQITFLFIKYSVLVSAVTFAGYWACGRWIITGLVGRDTEEIFGLGLYIVGGLCLYNPLRPLISYGVIAHDARACLTHAIAPSAAATIAAYVCFGYLGQAQGMAFANIVGALLMGGFTLLYISRRTDFRWHPEWLTSQERIAVGRLAGGLRRLVGLG